MTLPIPSLKQFDGRTLASANDVFPRARQPPPNTPSQRASSPDWTNTSSSVTPPSRPDVREILAPRSKVSIGTKHDRSDDDFTTTAILGSTSLTTTNHPPRSPKATPVTPDRYREREKARELQKLEEEEFEFGREKVHEDAKLRRQEHEEDCELRKEGLRLKRKRLEME